MTQEKEENAKGAQFSKEAIEACKGEIDKAKLNLVDLSRRNPLISFKQRKVWGSSPFLRAVNTTISDLVAVLEDGQLVTIHSLPPVPCEEEAPEEQPREEPVLDQQALDAARVAGIEDPAQILAENKQLAGDGNLPQIALEGGQEGKKDKKFDIKEFAKEHHIDPDYDLPGELGEEFKTPGWQQKFQTMLLEDDFRKMINLIMTKERSFREEKGVHTLYIAFGFLEWTESDDSEDILQSPLLLLGVQIEAELVKGDMRYKLIADDEGLVVNLALSQRLQRDFGIPLPDFKEGDTPQAYLELVSQTFCKSKSQWSVHNFVTLSLFPFGTLAMFQDLQGNDWPTPIEESPLLLQVLGDDGRQGEAAYPQERDYDIDSVELLKETPYLFLDADSSQHGAILDALSGENLVIQGPPGTGKSQTITNIIAAAMSEGKTVLFVAEKQAALQVVAKRLEKIGLGDFCLNLHSDEKSKSNIVDSLKQRVSRMSVPGISDQAKQSTEEYAQEIKKLSKTRQDLNNYQKLLSTNVGESGETIYNFMWRYNQHVAQTEPSIKGQKLAYLENAQGMTKDDYEKFASELELFEKYIKDILRHCKTPADHPWAGVENDQIASTDINDIAIVTHDFLESLKACLEDLHRSGVRGLDGRLTSEEIRDVSGKIQHLSLQTEGILPGLLEKLGVSPCRLAFLPWFKALAQYQIHKSKLLRYFQGSFNDSLSSLASALSKASHLLRLLPPKSRISDLSDYFHKRQNLIVLLGRLTKASKALSFLKTYEPPTSWPKFYKLAYNVNQGLCLRNDAERWKEFSGKAGFSFGDAPLESVSDILRQALPFADKMPSDDVLTSSADWFAAQDGLADKVVACGQKLNQLARSLDLPPIDSVTQARIFEDACALLGQRTPAIARALTPALCESSGRDRLHILLEDQQNLKEKEKSLEKTYNLEKIPDAQKLRACATTIEQAGFWGFLHKDVRQARGLYRQLRREKAKRSKEEQAQELRVLADFVENLQAFKDNADYQDLCGKHFSGLDFDLTPACQAADWVSEVRRTLAAYGLLGQELRKKLLTPSQDEAEELLVLLQNRSQPPQGADVTFEGSFDELGEQIRDFCRKGIQAFKVLCPLCDVGRLKNGQIRPAFEALSSLFDKSQELGIVMPTPLNQETFLGRIEECASRWSDFQKAFDDVAAFCAAPDRLVWGEADNSLENFQEWGSAITQKLSPYCAPERSVIGDEEMPPLEIVGQTQTFTLDVLMQDLTTQSQTLLSYLENNRLSGDVTIADLPSLAQEFTQLLQEENDAQVPEALGNLGAEITLSPQMDRAPLEPLFNNFQEIMAPQFPQEIEDSLCQCDPSYVMGSLKELAQKQAQDVEKLGQDFGEFSKPLQLNGQLFFNTGKPFKDLAINAICDRVSKADQAISALPEWSRYQAKKKELDSSQFKIVYRLWEKSDFTLSLKQLFDYAYCRSMMKYVETQYRDLADNTGAHYQDLINKFKNLDEEIRHLNMRCLQLQLLKNEPPMGVSRPPVRNLTEYSLLKHEVEKKKRHVPLRDLLHRAGKAVQSLKPCFMMSPMSVAHYLRPGEMTFDILVIDEASQMRPSEALGSFARAKQAVIVGDDMQLPPSRHFQVSNAVSEDDEGVADLESILSLCQAAFPLKRRLRFHYRSRHSSLINFSNHRFYDDSLMVPISPRENDPFLGVHRVDVEGLYGGQTRGNPKEVEAICQEAAQSMKDYPDKSIGLVTMNTRQRDFISDYMDKLAATDPYVREYISKWSEKLESFFVKSLEHVQGDERDIVLISTVFGPERPGGPVMQRFGPINEASGHRRLNVLFTRAKYRLVLFTSMQAAQIDAPSGQLTGRSVLKDYITYARDRRVERGEDTKRAPDSPFEELVIEKLRSCGYEVDPQVGVKGFFIDIGVRDRNNPTRYVIGIECDGASYHSSRSARDRDILRQQILEDQGWRIYRIWSTDWFRNMDGEMRKLIDAIEYYQRSDAA